MEKNLCLIKLNRQTRSSVKVEPKAVITNKSTKNQQVVNIDNNSMCFNIENKFL